MSTMKNFRSKVSRKPRKKRQSNRRRKPETPTRFQHPRIRFPRLRRKSRLDTELLSLLRQMRGDYPPPYYDPLRDGCFNPAEQIISWTVNLDKKNLRERCLFHGLSDEGTRFEMIRSLYLHYRSRKLMLGFPLVAYGEYHENENPPQCNCGKVKKPTEKIRRFPRLPPRRFPRLPKRYPRLPPKKGLNVGIEAEKRFMRDLSVNDPKRYERLLRALDDKGSE